MTKNEKRNRYWSGPQSSLFEASHLSDGRWEQGPSEGWCIVGSEVCRRSFSLPVGSCSFLIFPTGPWRQAAQAKMHYWLVSWYAFFLNYHQKIQWQRPCVAQRCSELVGTETLEEWMTGAAPSQRRWNVVAGMLSQIVTTRRMTFQVLIKKTHFHWLQASLNHCRCHPHSYLLLIKKNEKKNPSKVGTLLYQAAIFGNILTIVHFQERWVTVCAVHVFSRRLPPHHTSIALDQPVSNLIFYWHHLTGCCDGIYQRELAWLAEGKLSYVVLDLHFTWSAIIKFNSEGGMALDHGRGRSRRDTLREGWSVLCGNLINLQLRIFDQSWQSFLCRDLKVAGLPVVGQKRLGLTVR